MLTLSELDQRRFGHVTAKVELGASDDVEALLAECARQRVQLVIARCSTLHLRMVQELERSGFFMTDTLVYYRKERITGRSPAMPQGIWARAAGPEDAPEVERMAARAFGGYPGHYHADPRLDPRRCDEVYSSWAANCCRGEPFCDRMILMTSADGRIAGFAALKLCGEAEFDGVLFAVDPDFRGQGLFAQLLELSQQWGIESGCTRMVYSTQLTNVTAQRTLCRHGFAPARSCYTLHKWLA